MLERFEDKRSGVEELLEEVKNTKYGEDGHDKD